MHRDKLIADLAEVYTKVYNIGFGLWAKELPKLVKRDRELTLRKLRDIMVDDLGFTRAKSLSVALLPVKVTKEDVLKHIGGYHE